MISVQSPVFKLINDIFTEFNRPSIPPLLHSFFQLVKE